MLKEAKARIKINKLLEQSGWKVQDKKAINFSAGLGIAVRHYPTDVGTVPDYVLFVESGFEAMLRGKEKMVKIG